VLLQQSLEMKLKEIRPLHLDDKLGTHEDREKFYNQYKKSRLLKFYDNKPLQRMTSLFLRPTQIQIKELESADIDFFHSLRVK
jgi:hypothetical protein